MAKLPEADRRDANHVSLIAGTGPWRLRHEREKMERWRAVGSCDDVLEFYEQWQQSVGTVGMVALGRRSCDATLTLRPAHNERWPGTLQHRQTSKHWPIGSVLKYNGVL